MTKIELEREMQTFPIFKAYIVVRHLQKKKLSEKTEVC